MNIVIADSSTLIALLDTKRFALLFELFTEIIISHEVHEEITQKFNHKQTIDTYVSTFQLRIVVVEHDILYEMLIKRLDPGESESIVFAKKENLPLIIDERKGRKTALSLGIPIVGFIGIVLQLLKQGSITKPQAIKILEDVEKNDFRLSKALKALVYKYEVK